jgi:hypothetical protein
MSDTIDMSDSDNDTGSDDEKFVYRVSKSSWRTYDRGLLDPEQSAANPVRTTLLTCPERGKEMLKKNLKRHLTLHCKGKTPEVIIK